MGKAALEISSAFFFIVIHEFCARHDCAGMFFAKPAEKYLQYYAAATLTTHAIVLTACFAALITIIGILTIRPVFAKLGATGITLELTCRYMRICYWGTIIMALELVISDIDLQHI